MKTDRLTSSADMPHSSQPGCLVDHLRHLCIINHLPYDDRDLVKTMNSLLAYEVDLALDPKVSERAAALVQYVPDWVPCTLSAADQQVLSAVSRLFPKDMSDDGSNRMGFKKETIDAVENLRDLMVRVQSGHSNVMMAIDLYYLTSLAVMNKCYELGMAVDDSAPIQALEALLDRVSGSRGDDKGPAPIFDQLCQPLIDMLRDRGCLPSQDLSGHCDDMSHVLWMLEHIMLDTEQTHLKKMRWFGYAQRCLIERDIVTVKSERDRTRPILNGK